MLALAGRRSPVPCPPHLLLAATLGLVPAAAHAQTPAVSSAVLSPSQDNTLYESLNGGISNGAGQHMFCGLTSINIPTPRRRALVRFDVAGAVPAGATILGARLTLTMSRTLGGDLAIGLHRATTAWGEGTSIASGQQGMGGPATPGDATWLDAVRPTTPWTNAGGDFDPTASATALVVGPGDYTWGVTAGMTHDVQDWLDDPTNNHGWLLLSPETEVRNVKRFETREHPSASVRPRLEIVWANGGSGAFVASTGRGCVAAGRNAPMDLAATGRPTLGNSTFALDVTNGPASAPAWLLLAIAPATQPIPLQGSCALWLDPFSVRAFAGESPAGPLLLDGSGRARFALPIGTGPGLQDARLALQSIALDGAAGRATASNAAVLVLR